MRKQVQIEGKITTWLEDDQVRLSISNPHLPEPLRFSSRTSTPQGKLLLEEIQRTRLSVLSASGISVSTAKGVVTLQTSVGPVQVFQEDGTVTIRNNRALYSAGYEAQALVDASHLLSTLDCLGWTHLPRHDDAADLGRLLELLTSGFTVLSGSNLLDLDSGQRVQLAFSRHRIQLISYPHSHEDIQALDHALGSLPVVLILDLRGSDLEKERRERVGFSSPSAHARTSSTLVYGAFAEEVWIDRDGRIAHTSDRGKIITAHILQLSRDQYVINDFRRGRTGDEMTSEEAEPMLHCLQLIESNKLHPVRYLTSEDPIAAERSSSIKTAAEALGQLLTDEEWQVSISEDGSEVIFSLQASGEHVVVSAAMNPAGMLELKMRSGRQLKFSTVLLPGDITTERVLALARYGLQQARPLTKA